MDDKVDDPRTPLKAFLEWQSLWKFGKSERFSKFNKKDREKRRKKNRVAKQARKTTYRNRK